MEDKNELLANKEAGKSLELYNYFIGFCSEILEDLMDLSSKKLMDIPKTASLLIANRLKISSQAIRILILKGYYDEALILERSFYEGLGLCCHVSNNYKDAKNWCKGITQKLAKLNWSIY